MDRRSLPLVLVLVLVLALGTAGPAPAGAVRDAAPAAAAIEPDLAAAIDAAAEEVLRDTGVPGASVAVVRDGALAHVAAYGRARLDPETPATPGMRFPIGSISKQFTAAAVVMLAAEGRVDLEAPIARWFPDLPRAGDVTLRQLLSHTSGLRDYWPQDFVPAAMLEPITTAALLERHARQPLDFEPGTRYQYSNTGYVVAAAVVEQVTGASLFDFLRARIFEPLGMASVLDVDGGTLTATDATGTRRFALGPARPAPKEGRGWLHGAADLAMAAEDLARWDVAWIERTFAPDVFDELTREVLLASGVGTGYGLGVGLSLVDDRRVVAHGGEVSGFTATNRVWPDERAAVVVLVNQDASNAAPAIARRIAPLLFDRAEPADAEMTERVRATLEDLARGRIDRVRLTANGNAYFSDEALGDFRASLKRLGRLEGVERVRQGLRGGLTTRVYRATYRRGTVEVVTRAEPDGRLEQLTLAVE